MPLFVHNEMVFDTQNLDAYVAQLKKDSADWSAKKAKSYRRKSYVYETETVNEKKEKVLTPHSFNPNIAVLNDWLSFGLTKAQVNSINKYLQKGGKFRTKSDVSKMYVIDEKRYSKMKPFLLLPDTLEVQKRSRRLKAYPSKKDKKNYDTLIVELNSADTTELKKLRGVGSYYAKQIVYYREKLGGYMSIGQLYEIENMREETVQIIEPFIIIDTTQIRKLHINSDAATVLVRHPYITWNMAKRIQDHRDFDHRFKSVNDLLKYGLLTEELYTKLVGYIEL